MHGHSADFLSVVSTGLGLYYLALCAMNWITALLLWRRGPSKTYFSILGFEVNNALTWFVVGCFLPDSFAALLHRHAAGTHGRRQASGQ